MGVHAVEFGQTKKFGTYHTTASPIPGNLERYWTLRLAIQESCSMTFCIMEYLKQGHTLHRYNSTVSALPYCCIVLY